MPTTAVVMLCGPYDEGDHTPTRRIDHAISIARAHEIPLFIAGDAFCGEEISRFRDRALGVGISSVIPAFDPHHCTLWDARAVGREILDRRLGELACIHLVTDWWHMDRALTLFEGELEKIVGRRILVVPKSVMSGPSPDPLVHRNERQGLEDYLSGRYGQRRVADPLRHRPDQSF